MTVVERPVRERPGVVIPAHNAARTIDACLASIVTEGDFEIVVVCNGCTDATASIARSHGPNVRVLELAEANKAAALNAGDRAVSGFPRVYADADVVFTNGGLQALVAALEHGAIAASPTFVVTTDDSPRTVRSYYAIWCRLGAVATGLCGASVYAFSEKGRARFGDFPDLVADDLFVDQRFAATERTTVPPGVTYAAPESLRGLLHRKTRVFAGNIQLARQGPPRHPGPRRGDRWFEVIVHQPGLIVDAPAYVAITMLTKLRAHLRVLLDKPLWVDP